MNKNLLHLCIVVLLCVKTARAFAGEVVFERDFAPQDGLVCRYEEPIREEICLNGLWRIQADANTTIPGETASLPGAWEPKAIKDPSPWNVNSFSMNLSEQGGDFLAYPSYPKAWENVSAAWMEKTVTVPANWSGKRLILHFGAVAGDLVVYVNGRRAGEGFDIFFAQEIDVTGLLHLGAENQILVKVISPKVFDHPGHYGRREYLSGSFWGTHIAGIWQDVFLLAEPPIAISDVFVQSRVDHDELYVEATITNRSSIPAHVDLSGNVREWMNLVGTSVTEAPEINWKLASEPSLELAGGHLTLDPNQSKTVTLAVQVGGRLKLWRPDSPNLYGLLLNLSVDGQPVDVKYQRFGWRQFTLAGGKLDLNGRPIILKGDSWHFMGVPQMSRRYAYAWYRLLKDAGANAVRLHASVYPSFYHDMADEMGIMILDESAIWLSDGGPKADSDLFWQNCRTHIQELVRRDRNHPSVFGWSVCNEILPVLRNVWHSPPKMIDHCLNEITVWVDLCRTNDPTRGWISGDGEWDASGRLPVINIHYGGDAEMQRAAESGKPWAMGETSMAYYGTPRQVAKFDGNRAYESEDGRMEGLAAECYSLMRSQQKYGASYQSVFNIVWYSVQPLPLGKRLVRASLPDDGIVFGEFRDGVPGMQPERLGPYSSTLNPGYDPALPLYRPWPMFAAIRDANLKVTNSLWDSQPKPPTPTEPVVASAEGAATLAFLPANGLELVQELGKAGVKAAELKDDVKNGFLLLDGSSTQDETTEIAIKNAVNRTLSSGGTVWIWDIQPAGAAAVSRWLGGEVLAGPRTASSFVLKQMDPLLSGLDNASLYFSEDDDWRQMSYGLTGGFVQNAQVLLEACPADWRRWNYKPEPVKTAALYRSEEETTGPRAVIATAIAGGGRVILCNLDSKISSIKKALLIQQLFRNEGIKINQVASQDGFLDLKGRLMRALVCGSFGFSDTQAAYVSRFPTGEIRENAGFDGHAWHVHDAIKGGVFDFKSGLVDGPQDNAYAYIAVWIKSPNPLNDLLSEPNLPKLSFTYGSDDGCQLWLNGDLLATHDRTGPLDTEMFSQNPLLLKLGWNQLVIKVVQLNGAWKFAGKFGCSDLSFLSKLQFAAAKPDAP